MSHNNEQRLIDPRAKYQTRQRVTFYRSVINDIEPLRFGYLLRGAGRHYVVDGEHVSVMPIASGQVSSGYIVIERAEFDRLLVRYVLPPVFDNDSDAP